MKKEIKCAAFLLIFVLIFTLFSCTANSQKNEGNRTAEYDQDDNAENTAEETTEISDDLPEENYGGYNFRIYSPDGLSEQIFVEEAIGEVIKDAQYGARLAVEERFNVKICLVSAGAGDLADANRIKKSVMAGDDAYDLIYAHDISLCTASLDNVFVNLYSIPHLNFTKPYWPKNSVDTLTVLGQMYVFSNAMTTYSISGLRVIYMNKDKARDYGITVPYQDVFDGAWTLDKLMDMTKDVYTDLNGNGEADEKDFYGFEYRDQYFICTLEPLGIKPYIPDAEEIIKLNLNNARTMEAVDKMYSLLFGSKSAYFTPDNSADKLFLDNRALTTCLSLGSAANELRFTDVNYGMLPMPKLNAVQEDYYAGYTSYLFAAPNTVSDLDRTGMIIEAMSAECYKKVRPAYFEIALKNKYMQDEESIKMLDLIDGSKMLDLSWCYNVNYAGPYWFMRDLFIGSKTPSTDFSSWYGKNEAKQQKILDDMIKKFEDMQGN